MRRNKHTFSSPSMKIKSRYAYKVNTAMVRDSSNNKISPNMGNKAYFMPKTGQRSTLGRAENHRISKNYEERKSSRSVRSHRSNSSIISTASSNSPGGKKNKMDSGLHIVGQQVSKRRGGGTRFDRTPLTRKPKNGLRNYQNNMSLENRVNKLDKKQVLANLNKQYRNKFL
jgi:hypothetical protein